MLLGTATSTLAGSLTTPYRAIARTPALETTTLAELGELDRFDVCIIGSGPAGAILARHLVDAGIETLMLESGPAPGASDPRFAQLDVYSTVDIETIPRKGTSCPRWVDAITATLPP